MAIMKNECDIGIKASNSQAASSTSNDAGTVKTTDKEAKKEVLSPLSVLKTTEVKKPQQTPCESEITESSTLLQQSTKEASNSKDSSFKKESKETNRKKPASTITSNYLPEEASPLLKQKPFQTRTSRCESLRSSSYRPKPTLLYATTCGEGGRSASIAVSSSQLEPTYPWDYDQDNDDVGDNTSYHSDVFSGMVTKEDRRQMYESKDEYQHPSLETRKQTNLSRGRSFGVSDDDGLAIGEESGGDGESAVHWCEYSFRCIHLDHPVRKLCINLVSNPWFERLTMTVILLNCVTLGMFQPCEDADCNTQRCKLLKVCDHVIYAYFTLELCVKIVAMGVIGKGCYLSETWNRLDFFIVFAGALEYCLDVEKLNLSTIRTVRVLRPLRAINRIPSMRILVMLLLDTLPMLGNVLLLCFFVFFIFGIIGVQLWAGLLRQRCYIPEDSISTLVKSDYWRNQLENLYYVPQEEDEKEFLCAKDEMGGMHKCNNLPHFEENGVVCYAHLDDPYINETDCIDWNHYYTSCQPGEGNPFDGAISFDNIGLAWVAIFLVISLEGWTDVLYFVQDVHSFWNWLYFVLLIVIGSFFMINLCLVVIATQFSETKRRETAKMKAERARFRSSSTLSSFTNSETTNCYREIIKLIAHMIRKAVKRGRKTYKAARLKHLQNKEKKLIEQKDQGKLDNYNVMKNVSTHSMVNVNDGKLIKLEMRLELEDISIHALKNQDKSICHSEKMTQTDIEILGKDCFSTDKRFKTTPNGTSPCNHPTLSCQELLALSTALSATLTAQLAFDPSQLKYCSTYRLAEAVDQENKQHGIYHLGSEYELAVTPKKMTSFSNFFESVTNCFSQFRKLLEKLVDHNIFQRTILFCILTNTFCMGIEFHSQPELLTKVVEFSNLAFSCVFAVEMILKVTAYGVFRYISDGFNVFDGVIVLLSSFEIYTGLVHGVAAEGSGLSVLRTFRLLRILKLVRFLPNLRRQLVVMLRTMDNVAVFFGLLMLFIFIFSILGMNLFGCKFRKIEKINGEDVEVRARKNFDSLLWATVTVFQVLTQEDWNLVLFLGMERTNHWAALYFVALMTFGNYVLFNLLVAILVEGFSNQDEKRSVDDNSAYSKERSTTRRDREGNADDPSGGVSNNNLRDIDSPIQATGNITLPSTVLVPPRIKLSTEDDGQDISEHNGSLQDGVGKVKRQFSKDDDTGEMYPTGDTSSLTNKQPDYSPRSPRRSRSVMESLREQIVDMGEPRQLVLPCPGCGDNRVVMARQVKKEEVESNPLFAEFLQRSRATTPHAEDLRRNSSLRRRTSSKCNSPCDSHAGSTNGISINGVNRESFKGRHRHREHHHLCSQSKEAKQQMITDNNLAEVGTNGVGSETNGRPTPGKNGLNGGANSLRMMGKSSDSSNGQETLSIRRRIQKRWEDFKKSKESYSLWWFPQDNKFRMWCCDLTSQGWFDFVILIFIACNCITLAMERPNIPPWSFERDILNTANHVFTVVFGIEMYLKAVSTGLFYGEHAYFKSGWNIMDGSLVLISVIDTTMTAIFGSASKIFDILRVFRLVRALRPLRVINRAPGLKLVVQTLLSSLKPIGNIVLICCTFFIIFGILGVQLFKGVFYHCEGPDADTVKNKTQCLELSGNGNKWINKKYNFDNLGQALMSLFVLSSKDGWVNIMYSGLDAVGVDQQPRQNFNEWRLIYFISFLLLVGFFVLNMFVGVVVENFHRCRAEQEKEERARRAAKRAKKIEERRRKMMQTPYYIHYSPPRMMIHKMVTSKYFDLAISAVIGLNVITMAMEFYMMPRELNYALKVFNYFFTIVFILEAVMKVSALGCGRYMGDRWNQLDVAIVFLSVVGIVLEELKSDLMPINPTIMRVMRVLRIARVLKLLKMAKGIRALLDTVMQALPQVGNLGLLFFLLFFIFAALGVEMFGRLECDEHHPCQGLGEHAHFRSFGMAFLTLFRIATGDNWNGIMKDTLREECEEGDDCLRNCCVSPYFAPLFFVVFVLMAQFVLVNVVVAVLMKHLEESHKQMEDDVEVELELEKQLSLAHEMF